MDCSCDYEPASWFRSDRRTARKSHRCYECSGTIAPGDKYDDIAGMWDGYIDYFKICSHCREIRTFVQNSVPCFCWAYGNLNDDARDAIRDAYDRASDEVRGLWTGYARRVIRRDRHNAAARQAVAA